MDKKEAFSLYKLAKTNIQLENAVLESMQITNESNNKHTDLLNEVSFGIKTEFVNESEINGYLKVIVESKDEINDEVILTIEIVHKGNFKCKSPVDQDQLEEWAEIQVVPQLLPYSRSLITNVTSLMDIPTISLPTMDILESIKMNRKKE